MKLTASYLIKTMTQEIQNQIEKLLSCILEAFAYLILAGTCLVLVVFVISAGLSLFGFSLTDFLPITYTLTCRSTNGSIVFQENNVKSLGVLEGGVYSYKKDFQQYTLRAENCSSTRHFFK